jgi:hypothetical protein
MNSKMRTNQAHGYAGPTKTYDIGHGPCSFLSKFGIDSSDEWLDIADVDQLQADWQQTCTRTLNPLSKKTA